MSAATLWLTADHLTLAKTRPRTLGGQRDRSAVPLAHVQRGRELRRGATPPERGLPMSKTQWIACRPTPYLARGSGYGAGSSSPQCQAGLRGRWYTGEARPAQMRMRGAR